MTSHTGHASNIETVKLHLVIFGGDATFDEPIKLAKAQIASVRRKLVEAPATRIGIILDVSTPDYIETEEIFNESRTKLRAILRDISNIPLIDSLSINVNKWLRTPHKQRSLQQPDKFIHMIMLFFMQTARKKNIPNLTVRVSTPVDDSFIWLLFSSTIEFLSNPAIIKDLENLCVVLNFEPVEEFSDDADIDMLLYYKASVLEKLKAIETRRPGLKAIYHLQGATPFEFVEAKGITVAV